MSVTAENPAPEDDDLSCVLHGIGFGMLASTRARLANSVDTRHLLELGLGLLRRDLLGHTGPDFDSREQSPLFKSISRDRILELAGESADDRVNRLSVNMFRHRWDRKDRYTEDLISYMFRLAPQSRHLDEMDALSEQLVHEMSINDFVRALADHELKTVLNDPMVGVQVIVQSAMPNHPRVRDFCRAQLDNLQPRWARLYEKVAIAYGLELRPGRTWLDVAIMFNAVIEGEMVWARVGEHRRLSNGESVLAGTILALLPSVVTGPGIDHA